MFYINYLQNVFYMKSLVEAAETKQVLNMLAFLCQKIHQFHQKKLLDYRFQGCYDNHNNLIPILVFKYV